MHVRAEFAEDGEDMAEILENKTLDLVLFSIDLPGFSLSQARQLIAECGRHVALIAMAKKVDTEVIVAAIDEGAQDVVASNSLEHLIQVIKRESFNINIWRRAMRSSWSSRKVRNVARICCQTQRMPSPMCMKACIFLPTRFTWNCLATPISMNSKVCQLSTWSIRRNKPS